MAFGDGAGFLWAWLSFFVVKGGGQAVLGLTFGQHLCAALPARVCGAGTDAQAAHKAAGLALLVVTVAANCGGVRRSAAQHRVTAAVKAALVASLLAAAAAVVAQDPAAAAARLRLRGGIPDLHSLDLLAALAPVCSNAPGGAGLRCERGRTPPPPPAGWPQARL